MKLADIDGYTPIVHSGIAPDGCRAYVVIPQFDRETDAKRLHLLCLDLDASGTWTPLDGDAISLFAPVFAPDSRHLAVFRVTAGGADAVIFDLDAPDEPPLEMVGLPSESVALKWAGSSTSPACLGLDPDGCYRVWVWRDPTVAPVAVTPPGMQVADYAFRPGSSEFAWMHAARSRRSGQRANAVYVHRTPGGEDQEIVLPVRVSGFLCWSPDGRWLAFLGHPVDEPLSSPLLWVVDPSGWPGRTDALRCLTRDAEGWITSYDWASPSELVVAIDQGTLGRLYRITVEAGISGVGPVDAYLTGPSCANAGSRALFLQQHGGQPQHLRSLDLETGHHHRVTQFNAALAATPLAPSRTVEWFAGDGRRIEGVYLEPADSAEPPPLLVWIHGGPAEHLEHTFSPHFQVLVDAGYAVLAPNYRGSTGRSNGFLRLSVGDLCGADAEDVVAGIEHLVSEGWVSPQSVGIIGWSYGGTLALAVAARSDQVRAAVVGAPVVDWVSVFGATTYPKNTPRYFTSAPWVDRRPYDRASPLTWIAKVRIPVLAVHGEQDTIVPPSQSLLLFRALDARGVLSKVRFYPGEGHVFTRPWAVRELLAEMQAWFGLHLNRT